MRPNHCEISPESSVGHGEISAIQMTPVEFKTKTLDGVEEDPDPHPHPVTKPVVGEARSPKRLWILMQPTCVLMGMHKDAPGVILFGLGT